jgi:drug/metabolite transporter (DMT)-like permease
MSGRQTSAGIAIALCALLWSTGGILIKSVDWSPFAIAGARSIVGALSIMLLLRRKPVFVIRTKTGAIDRVQTAICFAAALAYSLTMILFVVANKLTTAANTILLQYTNPLYVILFGPLILGEKNSRIDYVTVAGVFAGMFLFLVDGLRSGNTLGNILAALSGIAFGFTALFMRKQKDGHPSDSFVLAHLITVVAMSPFCFTSGAPSFQSWGALLALGIFQIGIPSVLYSMGIVRVTAVSAVLITMLEPLMNPVWVFIFRAEAPSPTAILGGAVILGFLLLRTAVKAKTPHG